MLASLTGPFFHTNHFLPLLQVWLLQLLTVSFWLPGNVQSHPLDKHPDLKKLTTELQQAHTNMFFLDIVKLHLGILVLAIILILTPN